MHRSAVIRAATLIGASVLLVPGLLASATQAADRPAGDPPPAEHSAGERPIAERHAAVPSSVLLDSGAGRVLTLPGPAANVFVADSKVAEVRPASASTLFVFGVGPGRTTVAALDSNGGLVSQFDVTVQMSDFGASQAEAEIARLIPKSRVTVRSLPTTIMLSGTVESPGDATRAVAVAKAFAAEKQTVENQLTVRSSVQVTLQVRMVEMSRSLSRKLGVNWTAVGNFGQIGIVKAISGALNGGTYANGQTTFPAGLNLGVGAVIDALASQGMVRTLAEPNLTVISGQPASFLVGGQFPIPVPGGSVGGVTIDYKNYGVSLGFLPTVFSDGRISIHVAPEVSQLSSANAVTVSSSGSSIVVPSLTVRRAETTVELGSGQTFAIGGLLQDSVTGNRSGLPYLGDLPGIGAAFHDDQFERDETEVVILVTPYVVRPVSDPSALRVPNAAPVSSDLDRLLFMKTSSGSGQPTLAPTPGVAGFIVQ